MIPVIAPYHITALEVVKRRLEAKHGVVFRVEKVVMSRQPDHDGHEFWMLTVTFTSDSGLTRGAGVPLFMVEDAIYMKGVK